VKLNACPLTYRYRQIDASAWTAQFWKRIVFENWPIGRELGSPGRARTGRAGKAAQKQTCRWRDGPEAGMPRRADRSALAPNCGRVRLTICKQNAASSA